MKETLIACLASGVGTLILSLISVKYFDFYLQGFDVLLIFYIWFYGVKTELLIEGLRSDIKGG